MTLDEIKIWCRDHARLFSVTLELTQHCNFRCRHCYCADKAGKSLGLQEHVRIVDKLYDHGCLRLSFTGGEILTCPHFEALYRYAKDKGFLIELLTNASLLSVRHVELFRELPPQMVAITLYGTCEEEYEAFTGDGENFNRVMRALDLLKKNRIPFGLRAVAVRTLRESLKQGKFQAIADRYGVNFYYSPVVFPTTAGDAAPMRECLSVEQIVDLEENTALRKTGWERTIRKGRDGSAYEWNCSAGLSSMTVDHRGYALPCTVCREEPVSLLDNDLDTVLAHLRRIHARHLEIVRTGECSCCPERKNCKWCPAYAMLYERDETKPVDFFCRLTKARVERFGTETVRQ